MTQARSGAIHLTRAGLCISAALLCSAVVRPGVAGAGPWHATVGLLSGSAVPDPALADYQWNITPRASWGAQVLTGRGRFDAGVRMLSAETTQSLGLPGVESPQVRWTALEFVGQGRIATVLGTHVHAMGSVGRIHLGYRPDRVRFDPGGGSPTVTVALSSVHEWIAGGGLALKRPIAQEWQVGIEVDHRVFSMDTAHRNGAAIEYGRESFGEWNARLELAWAYGRI